jgi:hypothetical protein
MKKLLLGIALLLLPSTLQAQFGTNFPFVQPIFANPGGSAPCGGCLLYSYNAGTTTPRATYTDYLLGTPNPNPLVLDSTGRPTGGNGIYLAPQSYKFVLKTSGGATIWTRDNIFDPSSINLTTWAPSTTPAETKVEVGATGAHGTHQPTGSDFQNMVKFDLSNPATNGKQALYINSKLENAPGGTINITGLWVDSYTPPDNGGDVSGIHVIDTGSGDAASFFHFASERPVGYPLPCDTCGTAVEIGTDHGDALAIAIHDNATDGRTFAGQGIGVNVFTTGAVPIFNVVNKTPNTGAGQHAYRAGDDVGMDDRFLVDLDTGNTFAKGKITSNDNFIVGTFGKGIYWPAPPFANQPHIDFSGTTGQLEFTGGNGAGSGGTIAYNFLDNSGSSLVQMLTAGGIAIPKTTNQILLGTTPLTTLLNFPVPAAGITLTFPGNAATIGSWDTNNGNMFSPTLTSTDLTIPHNSILLGGCFSGSACPSINLLSTLTNASYLRMGMNTSTGITYLNSGFTGAGTALPFEIFVNNTLVNEHLVTGTDRTCIYINGGLRLLSISAGNVIDGGACP